MIKLPKHVPFLQDEWLSTSHVGTSLQFWLMAPILKLKKKSTELYFISCFRFITSLEKMNTLSIPIHLTILSRKKRLNRTICVTKNCRIVDLGNCNQNCHFPIMFTIRNVVIWIHKTFKPVITFHTRQEAIIEAVHWPFAGFQILSGNLASVLAG